MPNEKEREEQRRREILISDKRHSRDLENADEEPAPETVPKAAPIAEEPAPSAPTGEAGGSAQTGSESAKTPSDAKAVAQAPDTQEPPAAPPEESAESAQLRLLFEAGLPAYLHSQLQLILNFAMIYLGRQPNPANGLVSADLDKARLAIDLFEFIVQRTQDDLPEQDRAGLANLVGSLKMEYAQAAQGGGKPPAGSS